MFRRIVTIIIFIACLSAAGAETRDERIVKVQHFGYENRLDWEYSASYDEKGNITLAKIFDEKMRFMAHVAFTYDEDFRIVTGEYYYYMRELDQYILAEGDEVKRSKKCYMRDNKLNLTIVDEFDSNGYLKKYTEYDTSGNVYRTKNYTWINDHTMRADSYNASNDIEGYQIINFNAQGVVESIYEYSADGTMTGHMKMIMGQGHMSGESINLVIY